MAEGERGIFDPAAPLYDGELRAQGRGFAAFRRLMRRQIQHIIPPEAWVLDLGCGSGADTVYLLATGRRVLALDPSAGMLEEVRQKAKAMGALERLQLVHGDIHHLAENAAKFLPFQGVVSSLGPLNGEGDLERVSRNLHGLMAPGAKALLMPMSAICPWEIAWFLGAGQPRRALARLKRGAIHVPVIADAAHPSRRDMRCYFPFSGAIRRDFGSEFRLLSQYSVGLTLPPPYLHHRLGWNAVWPTLERIDAKIGAWPILNRMGDHTLYIFEKR